MDNGEDLDIAMSTYNLFEYSSNWPMLTVNLWNYYRDEIDGVVTMFHSVNHLTIKQKKQEKNYSDLHSLEIEEITTIQHSTNFKCWSHNSTQTK